MLFLCFCYNAHSFFDFMPVYFKLVLRACCRKCATALPGVTLFGGSQKLGVTPVFRFICRVRDGLRQYSDSEVKSFWAKFENKTIRKIRHIDIGYFDV